MCFILVCGGVFDVIRFWKDFGLVFFDGVVFVEGICFGVFVIIGLEKC